MKIQLFLKVITLAMGLACFAQAGTQTRELPRGLADFEKPVELGANREMTDPPTGHIRALAEWEDAEAVMTLWENPSLIAALAAHGNVKILAGPSKNEAWWGRWLDSHNISKQNISYFTVRTDSIWVRDYGPWFILDGAGKFGIVDTIYNRPRPNDDKVPQYLGQELGIPVYQPGLVHTGGNFYNDGVVNGFSSTLVYSENSALKKEEIDSRMLAYLGIERYATSPLAPKITIEHLDTFGKLVTPDTWVFSEFPAGSRFRKDSEAYVAMLKKLPSPYGTPYKILRLKMHLREGVTRETRAEDYRAYINSFISNRALFYPTYGDEIDEEVKAIYQEALPGYAIVGVDNDGTAWGDSVHCRNRNLLRHDTLHLFASVEKGTLKVEAFPSPGAVIESAPLVTVRQGGQDRVVAMARESERLYTYPLIGRQGETLSFRVTAADSRGVTKSVPQGASHVTIDYLVP